MDSEQRKPSLEKAQKSWIEVNKIIYVSQKKNVEEALLKKLVTDIEKTA